MLRRAGAAQGTRSYSQSLARDESGFAIVTVVLLSFVIFMLATVTMTVAQHESRQSANDRQRIQATSVAEAGLNYYFSHFETATASTLACSVSQTLNTEPAPASYTTTATLFDSAGNQISCPPPTGVIPASALLRSVGTVSGRSPRTLQAKVDLVPKQGTINQAIFSNSGLSIPNRLTVNGDAGNDGDIYTNGNFSMSNNILDYGSVYAQGSATISSTGQVRENLWANGTITMSNSGRVFGNATSSTSSITLTNSARIDGDARAGTTITADASAIGGNRYPGSPQGPPPMYPLPQLAYDATSWENDGYTVRSFATCDEAKAFIMDVSTGVVAAADYVVRITPLLPCELSFTNNTVVNVRGKLAIVTDGSFRSINNVTFQGVGGDRDVHVIVPYPTAPNPPLTCTGGSYDITTSNSTSWNAINLLVYTPCTVSFGNNNAGGVTGQLIGGTVTIQGNMTLNFHALLIPGYYTTGGFDQKLRFVREVRNAP